MIRQVLISFVAALLVNEATGVSPWIARRLAHWSARKIYTADCERAARRTEEWEALVAESVPTNFSKLVFGLSFGSAALCCVLLRRVSSVLSAIRHASHSTSKRTKHSSLALTALDSARQWTPRTDADKVLLRNLLMAIVGKDPTWRERFYAGTDSFDPTITVIKPRQGFIVRVRLLPGECQLVSLDNVPTVVARRSRKQDGGRG